MNKDYWVDADIDGTPKIGVWQAKNKEEVKNTVIEFYKNQGIPEREILIRNIESKKDYGQLTANALKRVK